MLFKEPLIKPRFLEPNRHGEHNPGYHWVVLRDYFKSLLSLDAPVAAVKTIVLQSTTSADRDDAGFNPARDFAEAVSIEGPHALFAQKMASLETKYTRPWYFRDVQGQPSRTGGELEELLDIAAAQGIKVYLFTNPFHESCWEPAHYRQELGDLMVNAMLSDTCATEIAFGRRVF